MRKFPVGAAILRVPCSNNSPVTHSLDVIPFTSNGRCFPTDFEALLPVAAEISPDLREALQRRQEQPSAADLDLRRELRHRRERPSLLSKPSVGHDATSKPVPSIGVRSG